MKRDILDYLGNKIGVLELPDGTSEAVWAYRLSIYARPPKSSVPESVTPSQIRVALIMSGIPLESVESAMEQLPDPQKSIAQTKWEYSTVVLRKDPLVDEIAPIIGLTSQQVDEIFVLASSL